ncbi:MAG: hypothetical protein ACE15D_05400 [Candidatus Eisenbacteria bacterium]|nr:hypothetical protein [Candidatus Eisenbacteria bacterium]
MPANVAPRLRTLLALIPAALLLALVVSCSDESAPRSAVWIESIHGGQALESDVYNNGDDDVPGTEDDFIIEDQVAVEIHNQPSDPALSIDPTGPYGAVVFDRYKVTFHGTEQLDAVEGAMHLRVPSGSTATGEITIVPAGYKMEAPLQSLQVGGELLFTADIVITGKEEDSGDAVRVEGSLPVHCANWADPK